ncbi:MAG: hypothetical protein ACON4X_05005 [Polaribacter sp.]
MDDFVLKLKKDDIKESKQITFSFLQDTKHGIYFPYRIRLKYTENNTITSLMLPRNDEKITKKELIVTLPTRYDVEQLSDEFIIIIEKNNKRGKNTLAVDKIIFN